MQVTTHIMEASEAAMTRNPITGFLSFRLKDIWFVEDIPCDTTDAWALIKVLTAYGLPIAGTPHQKIPSAVLNNIVVRPSSGTDAAYMELLYETPPDNQFIGEGGLPIVVIRFSSQDSAAPQQLDRNNKPIQVWYPNIVSVPQPGMVKETGTAIQMENRETLIVQGFIKANNNNLIQVRATRGGVNDAPWMDKPKGFWRCSHLEVENVPPPYASYLRVHAEWQSGEYNWMTFVYFTLPNGKPPADLKQDQIAQARTMDYSTEQYRWHGFTTVGLYALIDFKAIYGIG